MMERAQCDTRVSDLFGTGLPQSHTAGMLRHSAVSMQHSFSWKAKVEPVDWHGRSPSDGGTYGASWSSLGEG